MKKVIVILLCLLAVGTMAQNNTPDEYAYNHAIREAIRAKAHGDVSFGYAPPTYERIAPPTYERKYVIKVNGQAVTGYAKVKYNGGDPKNLNNWTVIKSYIE